VIRAMASRCEPRGIVGTTSGDWLDAAHRAGIESIHLPLWPSSLSNALASFAAIRRLVRSQDVSLIHSHHRFVSVVGRAVAALESLPFISTVHDLAAGNRLFTRAGIGETVTVFSAAVANHLVEFGISPERIVRLPMGVLEDPTQVFSSTHGDVLTIAFAGRLAREKGVYVLLEAIQTISARARARLIMIGDGEEREPIEEIIAAGNLNGIVTLTGPVEDVRPLLAQSDVVVVPSLREGFGRVVIEAFAAGVPVVASDTGGLHELVRDRVNGILVPPGDPMALTDAVVSILNDPDFREALKAGVRDVDLSAFTVDSMTKHMSRVYQSVLKHRD
jgi:glycosyltransferase involved in cell wall biosynthesis